MLLTSGQVSVILSTIIIFLLTSALFLSGYVVQQKTVANLRAAIRPPPKPIHTNLYQPPAPPSTSPKENSPDAAAAAAAQQLIQIPLSHPNIPGISDDEADWAARRRAEAAAAAADTIAAAPPEAPEGDIKTNIDPPATHPADNDDATAAYNEAPSPELPNPSSPSFLERVKALWRFSLGARGASSSGFDMSEGLSRAERRRLFRVEIERAAEAEAKIRGDGNPFVYRKRIE
ncbi:MAG: hypothetical protein M1818_003477 [Claussenomyces sp. TS43310]|nr:MAG: hypothetical protein M1818_003477 [Claussenomyces sp. TS43310]